MAGALYFYILYAGKQIQVAFGLHVVLNSEMVCLDDVNS